MLWPAGAAAIAAMGVRAFAGHAAGVSFAVPPEPAQWAHFVAAGLWVGGLLLALLLVRETADDRGPRSARSGGTRRSPRGRCSSWCAPASLRTWSQLGGPGGLVDSLDTAYGRVLLLKIVVALAIVGLGAVNRYRSIPRLGDRTRARCDGC